MELSSDINRFFADTLREFRRNAGISQEKLALEANLDRTYISLLERGLRQPTIKTLFAISAVLGVHPYEIIQATESAMQEDACVGFKRRTE